MSNLWRTAAGALFVGVVTAMLAAGPAAADVAVEPDVAPRGGPARLSFTLTEQRPGAHTTKVQLIPPAAAPIAEVYPMSVTGWAPTTSTTKLAEPVDLIHGTQTSSVVTSITWSRTGGAPKTVTPVTLAISLGPMPDQEQVEFTLVQTYSDGTVVRWGDGRPGPVVKLVRAPAAGAHQQADAAPEQVVYEEETTGAEPWLIWILGGAVLLIVAFSLEGIGLAALDRRLAAGSGQK